MKKTKSWISRSILGAALGGSLCFGLNATGAPPGPTPVVPEGSKAPGAFPNTSVTGANVIAKGSATGGFTSDAEVTGFEGSGPIPWVVNRYNRGDYSLRLAPEDAAAANSFTLNKGFTQFNGATDSTLAENRVWRPDPTVGVVIPTARQNGPIDWSDGAGPFYPTVAISSSSSGAGYSMVDGTFGTGQLDINTGSAGNPPTGSPEANFSFSVSWFPYDAGWIGGNVGNPDASTGAASWNGANQHSAGLSAGLMTWMDFPQGSLTFGGLGELRLPGVNATNDGMIFTTSSQGDSDINLVGVAPVADADTGSTGWLVTIREDSSVSPEEIVGVGQCQFEFVYVPYTASNLAGGYINGTTGAKIHSAGNFTLNRTGAGKYEFSMPGKSATNGTLLLQVADQEDGTSVPMASRAFLSYQYDTNSGKFLIQSQKMDSDSTATLVDADFYVAWVDFATPLSMPDGLRMRSQDAVKVTDSTIINAKAANIAVNTDQPELLVLTIDSGNSGGYVDSTTQSGGIDALIGYFYDARSLTNTRGPFLVMANSAGVLDRVDAKYNPISHQYDVVVNARGHSSQGTDELMIALVNPSSIAGANEPAAKVFTYDGLLNTFSSPLSYDDVSLAVSTKNGNFIVVAEHKQDSPSGEGAFGALFKADGTVLTTKPGQLDLLQPTGDVDDPDVVYLPQKDVFLFISNTDMSGGLGNRIVGSAVQTTPSAAGELQVSGSEQLLAPDSGSAQGHPAAIENPFNGEIITAYDYGNGTAQGNLTYYNMGAGPTYTLTEAHPPVPYLNGTGADPFKHQHPQLAADPTDGVIAVGFQAYGSSVGYPNAYAFTLLDENGAPLPSPFGSVPYFLTDSSGPISSSVNYHNIKYDPVTDSFIVIFNSTDAASGFGATYVSSFSVYTAQQAGSPALTIERNAGNVVIRWPASASGFALEQTANLTTPNWQPVGTAPTTDGTNLKVTVPVSGTGNMFFRLKK